MNIFAFIGGGALGHHVIKLVIKIRSDELTTLMSQPPEDDDGDGIGDLNAVQKMLGTIREVFRDAVF